MNEMALRPVAFDQRSEEWLMVRTGKITASRMVDVMNVTKAGAPGAGRLRYFYQLVSERIAGEPAPGIQTWAMRRGAELEPFARAEYELITGSSVIEVGFVEHLLMPSAGASPDGFVGDDGLIEIKCPETHTHLMVADSGEAPEAYLDQMQWQMACTGRQWCDFVSYDDRLPFPASLFIRRVARDDRRIAELEAAVSTFSDDVDAAVARIMGDAA